MKRSSRVSLTLTVIIQLILVICFYFISAWKAPQPPMPVYGVELSLVSLNEETSSATTQVENQEEVIEETETPTSDQLVEYTPDPLTEMEEASSEVVNDSDPMEELPEEIPDNLENLEDVNLDETTVNEVLQENNIDTDSIASEPLTESEQEESKDSVSNDLTEEQSTSVADSQTKEPVIDNRSLFSSQQGESSKDNSSFVFDVAGFTLAEPPKIDDPSSESGSITFNIEVSDDGYVSKIQIKQSTLSPTVASIYRDAVYELYFERTSANVPPSTSGTITFIIKTK